jgi:predicted nucleic acid-binding Zn ribbon protein
LRVGLRSDVMEGNLNRPTPDQGPELLGEVLSRLFTARGWGRRQGRLHLEKAWADAVGPEHALHSRVGNLRRGVLEVEVDSAILLQELAHYHKRRLLEQLRGKLPGNTLTDIRFRAGTWEKKS